MVVWLITEVKVCVFPLQLPLSELPIKLVVSECVLTCWWSSFDSLSAVSGKAKRQICQEQRGAEAGERLRREHTKVPKMKPCEVRCGNPSQFEAERERTATEAAGWAVTFQERWSQSCKRICRQVKSESKPGNRASEAIIEAKLLFYKSNKKVFSILDHRTQFLEKVFQPTHAFGHETPQRYFALRFTSKRNKKHSISFV